MKLTSKRLFKLIKEEVNKILSENKTAYDAEKIAKEKANSSGAFYDTIEANGNNLQMIFIGSPTETDDDLHKMFYIPKGSFADDIEKGVREFFEDHGFKISDIHVETTARGGPEHLFIDITFRQ